MSFQNQVFLPVMNLGSYSFIFGPNDLQFDREHNIALHEIASGLEQSEPAGNTLKKLTYAGFLYSINNQSLTDSYNWTARDGFFGRPVTTSFFTQDSSSATSSQPIYADVGYIQTAHMEFKGGYGIYKYWYRFTWIQANPTILIAGTTSDSKLYSFNVGASAAVNLPGYIAGLGITGTSMATTGGAAQFINYVKNNSSTTIGSSSTLGGVTGNQLFLSSGKSSTLTTPSGMVFPWYVTDEFSTPNQSIACGAVGTYDGSSTTTMTGTYTAQFGVTFSTPPSNVYLIFVPL